MTTGEISLRDGGREPPAHLDERLRRALAPELEIQRVLGLGSSARVYLARERALDRLVTVKVLIPEAAASPETRARFEREARAAASIVHHNVAAVYRAGILNDGEPYIVMQYVRGRSLADRLAAEGPLDTAETRRIIGEVAAGLEAAHARGVVHRDIRPDNVLLDEADGHAIVTDFGLAALTEAWYHGDVPRLTRTGQLLGDPHYISPEQFRGEAVTETSDMYSVALVAYEALTGRMPHADAGAREAAVARLTGEPVELPPSLDARDPELAAVLSRCLASDPARRPSARAVARRLQAPAADDHDLSDWDTRPRLPPRLRRAWHGLYRRRVPQWVAGVAATAWLLLGAVDQLVDRGVVPEVLYPLALVTAAAAVAAAAVFAWFHGERGDQRMSTSEVWLLLGVGVAWLASVVAILG